MSGLWAPIAGGALIGLSAALLILAEGRVAGVSGMIHDLWERGAEARPMKGAFLLGLVVSAPIVWLAAGSTGVAVRGDLLALLVAGVAVGAGTRLANGCTSGHGVCGIARGSKRSIAATLTFMAAGTATVFVVRHVIGGTT